VNLGFDRLLCLCQPVCTMTDDDVPLCTVLRVKEVVGGDLLKMMFKERGSGQTQGGRGRAGRAGGGGGWIGL
jgi:hypothetical protein